jgi:periplasmic protein TonB
MQTESRNVTWYAVRHSRADLTRWIGSAFFALLLHAGAAAALLLDYGFGSAEPIAPPLAAMTVELAPLPVAPQKRVTEIPPGPEQVEQKVQTKPQPKERLFDPPPEIKTPPPPDALTAKQEEEPKPEQTLAADKTTAPPSSLAEEQEEIAAPMEGSPNDQASSATETWENKLLTHLEHYKRYPNLAQQRKQQDVIYLRFNMDRSGKVLKWRIERSAGYALLDNEVAELIKRASPLPPPPQEVAGNNIEMVVPVEFFIRRAVASRK